jgi:hypothetical protein
MIQALQINFSRITLEEKLRKCKIENRGLKLMQSSRRTNQTKHTKCLYPMIMLIRVSMRVYVGMCFNAANMAAYIWVEVCCTLQHFFIIEVKASMVDCPAAIRPMQWSNSLLLI